MKDWPIYYKDLLYIADSKSNIGLCTLWTPSGPLCDHLDKKSFNLGGQLYSKRGINFILRNVLANPIIDTIILCGADRSQSGETFMKFMEDGIDNNYKVKDDKNCEIQKEIDKEGIEDFRENVKVVDMRGEIDLNSIVKQLSREVVDRKVWAKPRVFKESKIVAADKFPSERTTFNVRSNYIWEAWVQILRLIMKFGSKKGIIKVGEVKELVNVISVIEKEDPYSPEIADIFGFSKKDLEVYYKDFFSSDKGSESYNYGERLYCYPVGLPVGDFNASINQKLYKKLKTRSKKRVLQGAQDSLAKSGLNQLEEIYEKYSRYHEDRGLIAAIWNPWIDNVKFGWMGDSQQSKGEKREAIGEVRAGNVPCMALLQFTYRSKKLHLTAYFRSNDMFDAWPRNTFALRKLQYDFAKRIGKKPGYLTTISNCAQIFEQNYKRSAEIIKKYKDKTFCRQDPRSTLVVELDGDEIVVRHMVPDGNVQLDEYRINGTVEKAALKLMDKLLISNVFSDKYQVADIAVELTKAEWCVKNEQPFIQDRDWGEIGK